MIGIIAPSEDELNPILEKILTHKSETIAMLKFHIGTIGTERIVCVYSGVCKVNMAIATQILIQTYQPEYVVLVGVAGSLRSGIGIGNIIIGKEIQYHDVSSVVLTEYHPWMKTDCFSSDDSLISKITVMENQDSIHYGKIITGEKFITVDEREGLIKKYQAFCVDMESASFAHVCYVNKMRFIVIRSISDEADKDGMSNFEKNVGPCSRKIADLVEKAFLSEG
jgi:adenosylhomocysteine nucleosidase